MKDRQIIAVRPRRGSDLERVQQERDNDMSDLLHDWATTFKNMLAESNKGDDR